MQIEIEVYETRQGKLPFNEWLINLADIQARQKIRTRLGRLNLGNFGNFEPIGDGVYELKIDSGPGYRVYFAHIKKATILLLCGGSKKTQKKDIIRAKDYHLDFIIRGKKDA